MAAYVIPEIVSPEPVAKDVYVHESLADEFLELFDRIKHGPRLKLNAGNVESR